MVKDMQEMNEEKRRPEIIKPRKDVKGKKRKIAMDSGHAAQKAGGPEKIKATGKG